MEAGADPHRNSVFNRTAKPSYVQDTIHESFKGRLKMPWNEFAEVVRESLSARSEDVDELKYLAAGIVYILPKTLVWNRI